MATGKRFYWIKLKDSFMTSDAVDFLMGQKDGANYVVLYQMLCLKTINTDGKLERHIGEIIIPYDEAKIQRDTKYFTIDTIRVALNLYKALGLIYQDENGTLCLTDHENLVGSETDYAAQKKAQRQKSLPEPTVDNVHTDVHSLSVENVHTEIEIRDRDKRLEKEKDKTDSIESVCRTGDVRRVKDAWNALGLGQITAITSDTTRGKNLKARINQNGVDKVLEAIERIKKSSFLQGQSKKGWIITFDWFVKPTNFLKVLEGNYDDHEEQTKEQRYQRSEYTL